MVTECFFNLFLEISQISKNRTIIIQIGKNKILVNEIIEVIEILIDKIGFKEVTLEENSHYERSSIKMLLKL